MGGENNINLLIKTDIDIEKLLKTDLRGYIAFIHGKLSDYFDFANHDDDSEAYSIANIERNPDESLETFISRVISSLSLEVIKNLHAGGALDYSINKAKPSTLNGFRKITDEDAAVLEHHMPMEQIIALV